MLKEKSTHITLLGVLHIERETTILDDIDRVILAIRKRLLTDFMIGDVAEELGLEKSYTQIIFSLASMYGHFWNGASSTSVINSPFGYERFSITNESTFDSYIKFKSIAEIIDDYYKKQEEYDRKLSRSILDSKSQDFEVEQPRKAEPFSAEISKDTGGTIKKDMRTIIIFYSWQSDVRYNRKAILDALRQAISEVERKIPGVHLKIDEATSNETGSPHIPNSILQNIGKSDIFIGDLSVVGKAYDSEKKLPNPNVSLELGYAISELTWSRIILLFNKKFGSFPGDLPFDIEKRRCVDFAVAIENDTNGIGQLRTELIARISEIITKNPQRNILSRNQVEIHQREKDIKTLESVLNLLRLKMMDNLFKNGYSSIYKEVPKKIKALNELMDEKQFFLFNEDARQKVYDLRTKLNVIAQLIETDYKRDRYDSGTYEHKAKKNIGTQNRFDGAKQKLIELDEAFTTFLNYIRVNYYEINIDAFHKYEDDE